MAHQVRTRWPLLPIALVAAWAVSLPVAYWCSPPTPRARILSPGPPSHTAIWAFLAPDGRTFLKGHDSKDKASQTVLRWDTFTGEELPSYRLPPAKFGETFVPSVAQLVVAAPLEKQVIEFRNIDTGELVDSFPGVFPSPNVDRKSLTYESTDRRQVVLLDLGRPTNRRTVSLERPPPVEDEARAGAISADGSLLAVADGSLVRLWEVVSATELPPLGGQGPPVRSLAFAPTGQYLAALALYPVPDDVPASGVASLWELPSRRKLAAADLRAANRPDHPSIGFDPLAEEVRLDGDRVPIAELLHRDRYDLGAGPASPNVRKAAHWAGGWAATLDLDQGALELRGHGAKVHLWDSGPNNLYTDGGPVFSPDGRQLFFAHEHVLGPWDDLRRKARKAGLLGPGSSMDSTELHHWDLATLQEGPALQGYPIGFSADGTTLVTECTNRVRYNFYDLPVRRPAGAILVRSAALPLLVCVAAFVLRRIRRRRALPAGLSQPTA